MIRETDSRARLQHARELLERRETDLGLRSGGLFEVGGLSVTGPVLEIDEGGGGLLRTATALLSEGGWVGFLCVSDLGWEAAEAMGMDLGRVLIVPEATGHEVEVAALLLDGVDLLCLGDLALSRGQERRLAAKARAQGATILTPRPWYGLSRRWEGRRGHIGAVV